MQKLFTTLLAICVLSVAAQAATVTLYNDQTVFNGALASFQTLTFDVASYRDVSIGYTENSVSFAGFNDMMYLANFTAVNLGTGGALAMPHDNAGYLVITFPTLITAVGFNARTAYSTAPDSFVITYEAALGLPDSSIPVPMATPAAWVGIVSDTPFSSIRIASNGTGRGVIDNLTFGTANQAPPTEDTPEVATLIMIGTGLAALRYGRRYIGPTVV